MVVKRKVIARTVTSALLAMLVTVWWSSRNPVPGEVSRALRLELQAGLKEIDLKKVTDFDWDELIIFVPYAVQGDVCPVLGLVGQECDAFLPQMVAETQYLLVFRRDGHTIHHEYHDTSNGHFRTKLMANRIPRAQSIFQVSPASADSSPSSWYLWPVQ